LPGETTKLQVPSPLQLSIVHASPSLQVYVVPPHCPAPLQTSFFVQALLSLQAAPLAFGLHVVWLVLGVHCWQGLLGLPAPPAWHAPSTTQLPGDGVKVQVPSPLQVSAVQASPSLQAYVVPPQVPVLHTSFFVQAFPSLHEVPSLFAGFEHRPVAGLQVPAAWHWSSAVQDTGVPALQCPAPSQVSAPLQGLPSLQLVPAPVGV
jgi:hypothetical protein